MKDAQPVSKGENVEEGEIFFLCYSWDTYFLTLSTEGYISRRLVPILCLPMPNSHSHSAGGIRLSELSHWNSIF